MSVCVTPAVRGIPFDVAEAMMTQMCRSRALEDRLHVLHRQGRLRGRLLSGRGQEAIPVGAALALEPDDRVAPLHRDLGVHLVRGTTYRTVLLHYFGKAAGPARGRDGDIHFGEWSRGVLPMVSHLPDSFPVALGFALAARLRGLPRIALAICGDGATSTGLWHETLNLASVLQAPIVFLIENNQYAYSTPVDRQYRIERLSDRAAAYAMPGCTVDGNDAIAVYRAVAEAALRARGGGGPTLLEAVTMRMDGHAVHDDASYVPPEVLDMWRARDPIERLARELQGHGFTAARLAEIRARADDEIMAAIQEVEAAADPDPASAAAGVYAQGATVAASRVPC